jgi:hypothetical protein
MAQLVGARPDLEAVACDEDASGSGLRPLVRKTVAEIWSAIAMCRTRTLAKFIRSPGRRERQKQVAAPRWPQPVAESYPGCRVRRRNRGYQTASSSRRVTLSVTKIRR